MATHSLTPMDYNHCKQIEHKQQQLTVSPKRSILTDHTNTNLLDITRKRTHFFTTEKHTSPPASPKLSYKRPKQETAPSSLSNGNSSSSLFSLLKNPFSIFHRWNPVRNTTPPIKDQRPSPPAPIHRPHTPMQDPLHPPGTSCQVTLGPTIKPWAYSNLRKDRDDLSSILSTPHRDTLSKNIFQTQTGSNKTVFKKDMFERRQDQSYMDLLHSKLIPTENLTSTPRPQHAPTPHCLPTDSALETTDAPTSSARLSSSLYPPLDFKTVSLSSNRFSSILTSEHTPHFKTPLPRNTNRSSLPKYDKQLALQVQ